MFSLKFSSFYKLGTEFSNLIRHKMVKREISIYTQKRIPFIIMFLHLHSFNLKLGARLQENFLLWAIAIETNGCRCRRRRCRLRSQWIGNKSEMCFKVNRPVNHFENGKRCCFDVQHIFQYGRIWENAKLM